MTEPTGTVTLLQSDIDGWTSTVTAAATALGTVQTTLVAYIQQLLAGQSTPLPAADEANINAAVTGLGTVVTSLQGLEPPTAS